MVASRLYNAYVARGQQINNEESKFMKSLTEFLNRCDI